MTHARDLLERYVEAKDRNRPELMAQIFRPDAVLSFSIATDEITFPREVRGLEAITRTLVSDFGQRFVQCKTYYVCESPPGDAGSIVLLPWLVVMRDDGVGALRVGKGYYRWEFARGGETLSEVQAMHIFIGRMAMIPDTNGELLKAIQRDLPYPWLAPAELRGVVDRLLGQEPALHFLRDFREAVSPPESEH